MPPDPRGGWWRQHFIPHPLTEAKDPAAMAGSATSGKMKLLCMACFEPEIQARLNSDMIEHAQGQRAHIRTRPQIIDSMWAEPSVIRGHVWVASHVATALNHLASCKYVNADIRQRARSDTGKGPIANTAPVPLLVQSHAAQPSHLPPELLLQPSSMVAGPSQLSPSESVDVSIPAVSGPPTPLVPMTAPLPQIPYQLANFSPTPSSHTSRSASPLILPPSSSSASPTATSVNLGSRRRSLRAIARTGSLDWLPDMQRAFEETIMRVTVSANLPLNWVTDPELNSFRERYIHPAAQLPSAKLMTTRLIPAALRSYRQLTRSRVESSDATASCDGWTGANYRHYVAFAFTAKSEVFILDLSDVSAERKTADQLLPLMKQAMEKMERDFGITVVAFVSDSSGETKKARALLGRERPDLVVPPCYAHQINLIVGDYFKCSATFFVNVDKANELITWLRSKTYVLGQLRIIQITVTRIHKPPLSVIRAVLTRWTAHYLAYRRLLDLRDSLRLVCVQDRQKPHSDIATGPADSKAKALDMMALIDRDGLFWHSLARMVSHLGPLALAANISQSARTRPDTVLLIFGLLYYRFDTLEIKDEDDACVRLAVRASIAKRWMDTDQEIFIAALILHPLFRHAPFSSTCSWTFSPNNIAALMSRLYCRLFRRETAPAELRQEVMDYLLKRGNYSSMPSEKDNDPEVLNDPLTAWQYTLFSSAPSANWPPLARLARRLFSICPNSASCERLFSLLKRILTPARTRLSGQNLQNIAELNTYIRAEQRARGEGPRQRARHLIPTSSSAGSAAPVATATSAACDLPSSSTSNAAALLVSEPATPATDSLTAGAESSDNLNTEADPDSTSDMTSQSQDSFSTIRDVLVQLSTQADNDNEIPREASTATSMPDSYPPLHVELAELFNFQNLSWLNAIEKQGQRNLDEELQLYDLLSLDAPADIDPDDMLD